MKQIVTKLKQAYHHPLAKGSFVVFAGSMLTNIGAYAYHLAVGRILGPERYGELASLFSFSYILNVPSLVLQTILTRYIATFRAKNEIGKVKSLSLLVMKWIFCIGIVAILIALPFNSTVASFLHIHEPIAVFYMYLTSLISVLSMVQNSTFAGLQLFTLAMLVTNAGTIIRLAGGVVGAHFGVLTTVFAGLLTTIIGMVIFFLPLLFVYKTKSEATGISKKELFSYGLPTLITLLAITSLYSTDIILAKHFLSATEAGYYAALSVMGKVVFFASNSITYVLFPVVAERTQQKSNANKLVYSGLVMTLIVSFAITCVYALFPVFALQMLFGSSYFAAAPYVAWFGVFISLYSLSNYIMTILLGQGHIWVWGFVAVAALFQILGINVWHETIISIINVNSTVCAGLFIGLLLYYRHAVKNY